MKIQNAVSLMLVAGVAIPAMASEHDIRVPHTEAKQATRMGNIYINAATNERIMSLKTELSQGPDTRGVDEFPLELWVRDNVIPCAQFDSVVADTAFVFELERPDGPTVPVGSTWLEWGDVPADTVVDGFLFSWAAQEPVDEVGDPVAGLDAVVTINDFDDGFDFCFRQGLLEVTIGDLAGNAGTAEFELFTYTIDLRDPVDPALIEIGDSDGDLQGATFHNELIFPSFSDADGDGRADFSHTMRVVQPNPATPISTYFGLAAPRGEFESIDGPFIIDETFPGGTAGAYPGIDIFTVFNVPDTNFENDWLGNLGFVEEFTCDFDGDGTFTDLDLDYVPWLGSEFALYGPGGIPIDEPVEPCGDDYNGDENVNFSDVVAFLNDFNTGDLAADVNGDGNLNFSDVVFYLDLFNNGCPA